VKFIRRVTPTGYDYFFANLSSNKLDGWVTLAREVRSAAILDPLTRILGAAALRPADAGQAQIYLQLAPGESLIVRTTRHNDSAGKMPPWRYRQTSGTPVALNGTWHLEFIKGGPELPAAMETAELKSWTEIGGHAAQRFAGTARYRLEFDAPATRADDWLLDLGDVRETARVRLNGHNVTTAWSLPFQVRVGEFLKSGRNVLELEVTNLAANRIRDLDRRGVAWKIMREINFVNINYKPFDASEWKLTPSGLLGPIQLVPLRVLQP
jgi:hypothetical protein